MYIYILLVLVIFILKKYIYWHICTMHHSFPPEVMRLDLDSRTLFAFPPWPARGPTGGWEPPSGATPHIQLVTGVVTGAASSCGKNQFCIWMSFSSAFAYGSRNIRIPLGI